MYMTVQHCEGTVCVELRYIKQINDDDNDDDDDTKNNSNNGIERSNRERKLHGRRPSW